MARWPWSELGIEETADKEAIRAAYTDRRAQLDLSMQISAYARLTEAREKALFLASELQRAAVRGDRGIAGAARVVAPPPLPRAAPAPAPPSSEMPEAPEPEAAEIPSLALDPEGDAGDPPEPEPEPVRVAQVYVDPTVADEVPAEAYEAEEGNRYRTFLDDDVDAFKGAAQSAWDGAREGFVASTSEGQRAWLATYWPLLLVGALAYCSFGGEDEDTYPDRVSYVDEAGSTVEEVAVRLPDISDAALAELFGDGMSYQGLLAINPGLLASLPAGSGETALQDQRAFLRRQMLKIREQLPVGDVIAINRLYLDWLRAGRAAGGDACLEVVSGAFMDGVPVVEDAVLERERAMLRKLAERAGFGHAADEGGSYRLPADLVAAAGRETGLSAEEVARALTDYSDPRNCDVRIALLEAMLSDPSSAPRDIFRRL